MNKLLLKHWHIIASNPTLKECFEKSPRLVHKRTSNICIMLVRADLKPAPHLFHMGILNMGIVNNATSHTKPQLLHIPIQKSFKFEAQGS